MKTAFHRLFGIAILTTAILLGGGNNSWAAISVSLTPPAVSNSYNGTITLQITGVTNGETVIVQKFLDLNANGVIDDNDWLVAQFNLTDGTNFAIGGVTNINVPGDSDAIGGQITALLNSQSSDFIQRTIGNYLFKISSPYGNFAPVTNSFSVTNLPYAQTLTGSVTCAGTNVPYTAIALFPPSSGGNGPGSPVGGTVADGSGHYSISMPAGNYIPMPIKNQYVADFQAAPQLTLGSGQTINSTLSLIYATNTISGRFVDASNGTVGLPGVFIPVTSQDGLLAVTFTDTNGNFSVPVTADQWQLEGESAGIVLHGYVGYDGSLDVDTTSGSVGGLTAPFAKATTFFYGTVQDSTGNPLPGVDISDYDNDVNYSADGYSDINGHYVTAALGNSGILWQVQVGGDSVPTNFVFSQSDSQQTNGQNLVTGQPIHQNFIGLVATNHITGNIQFTNNPVSNVGVNANANINGVNFYSSADTDDSGNYSLTVANGSWDVNVNCGDGDDGLGNAVGPGTYQCPDTQNVGITNDNGTANFDIQPCGSIDIFTPSPLASGQVGIYYSNQLEAVSCSGGVVWSSSNAPPGLTLYSGGAFNGTPTSAGTFNFTVNANDLNGHSTNELFSLTINSSGSPLQINTTSLPNGNVGAAYNTQLQASGGQPSYTWSLAIGSQSLPTGLTLSSNGQISGTPATNGLFSFIVQASDSAAHTATQGLGLILNPKPKLGAVAGAGPGQFRFLLSGGANQNYTVQVSTNLAPANWTTLLVTNDSATNAFQVVDLNATNKARFYRVLIGP
jgi:hypothetical protein